MKNILITGGAGFIGSTIALKLINKGYNVTVLDNLSRQIHGDDPSTSYTFSRINGKVKFIQGDVNSRSDWLKALDNQDAVIHLAAETGTGQSMYDIEKYVYTNIGGTAILLDILTNNKTAIKKVVVAESRAIYGEGKYSCKKDGIVYPKTRNEKDMINGDFECKCPICGGEVELLGTTEDSKIDPQSVYGITKQVQGQLVHMVCKSIGIPSVSFRYQNVYGPGQSLNNPYTGILSIFSKNLINGKKINIFEDGLESRDFVYIDDVADATICGLESNDGNYEVFNVGSGKTTTVLDVVKYLKEFYKSNSEIEVTGNFRLGDIRHNFADISKLKNILKFTPKYSFEAGVKKFCNWVSNEKIENDDSYLLSLEEMKKKGLMK